MADNTSRPEGTRLTSTEKDVAGKSATLIDSIDYDRRLAVFRGLKAGAGVSITTVDSDGYSNTDGKSIVISATGGGAGNSDTHITSVGSGESLVATNGKVGDTLQLKSIAAGSGIAFSKVGDTITIASTVSAGAAGRDGASWTSGNSAPSNSAGNPGDFYLYTFNGDVYQKMGASWVVIANIKGPAGATGNAGPAGTNGSTWISGSGVPAGASGSNGDFYLDYTNGAVYKKNSGVWAVVTNITGPVGPKGTDGGAGAKGADGATGAAGRGITGTTVNGAGRLIITYTDGTNADVGKVVGADGAQGTPGAAGAKGDTGAAGAKGDTGAAGTNGTNGATGAAGRGITSSTINGSGNLVLTYSDGTTADVGHVVGAAGPKGDNGLVTVTSAGAGTPVLNSFNSSTGALSLKTLAQGANVTITESNGLITISAASGGTGGSGSATFIGLTDVPSTFTGAANKFTKVNSAGTALVFGGVAASEVTGLAAVATTGSYADLLNKPTIYSTLASLTDVNTSGVANGSIIKYDSASSKWIVASLPAGGGSGTVTNVTSTTTAITVATGTSTPALTFVPANVDKNTLGGSVLTVGNGGTGGSSYTAKGILVGNGTSPLGQIAVPTTAGTVLSYDGTNFSWIAVGGSGTVTSISLTVPADLAVSPATITTSGTFAITRVAQSANSVFAGPATGTTAGVPTYRALVAADIPALDAAKITTGTLVLARGGTGADLSALNANQIIAKGSGSGLVGLTAPSAANTYLKWDGTSFTWGAPSSSGIAVQQGGSAVSSNASTLNFTGAGVTVTDVSGVPTVNIPGGSTGGGATNGSLWYKFKVGFSGSNPGTVSELPAGWAATIVSTDDIRIEWTGNTKIPFMGSFMSNSANATTGMPYRSRILSGSTEIQVDPANPAVFYVMNVTSTNIGATSGTDAYVYLLFA